jgi:hypothetical protein
VRGGELAGVLWRDTPGGFDEPLVYTLDQVPSTRLWGVRKRRLPRLPEDRDVTLHNLRAVVLVASLTAGFGTLHLIGWKIDFSTRVKQLPWRGVYLGGGTVLRIGCTVETASIIRYIYTTTSLTNLNWQKLKGPADFRGFRIRIPLRFVKNHSDHRSGVALTLRALPHHVHACY